MIVEPELRKRLKAARAAHGYSQRQLSTLSGANLSSVNAAETGRGQVSNQALIEIAKTLGVALPQTLSVKTGYDPAEWLTPEDTAQRMGIRPSRVRQLLRAGKIDGAVKLDDGHWVIPTEQAQPPTHQPSGPKIRVSKTGELIALERKRRHMPLISLAAALHMDPAWLELAEADKLNLGPDDIRMIASHLNGDPVSLGLQPNEQLPAGTLPLDVAVYETRMPRHHIYALVRSGRVPGTIKGPRIHVSDRWVEANTAARPDDQLTVAQAARMTGLGYDQQLHLLNQGYYPLADLQDWQCQTLTPPAFAAGPIEEYMPPAGIWHREVPQPAPCRTLHEARNLLIEADGHLKNGTTESIAGILDWVLSEGVLEFCYITLGTSPLHPHPAARSVIRAMELLGAVPDRRTNKTTQLHALSEQLARTHTLPDDAPEATLRTSIQESSRLNTALTDALHTPPKTFLDNPLTMAVNALRRSQAAKRVSARALRDWQESLTPEDNRVFQLRITGPQRATLEELGNERGVSRQAVHIQELRLRARLKDFLQSPEGQPTAQHLPELRTRLGTAVRPDEAQNIIRRSPLAELPPNTLLAMAGPFTEDNGWLIREDRLASNPTNRIIADSDHIEPVDSETTHRRLSYWGLPKSRHEDWLSSDPRIANLDGELVRRPVTHADHLVHALRQLQRPASLQELLNHLDLRHDMPKFRDVVQDDPRLVRTGFKQIGLAIWSLPEYEGISRNIEAMLEEHGPLHIEEVVDRMHQLFGARPQTVRSYAKAPRFKAEHRLLRNRRPDEPWDQPPLSGPLTHRGVFHLGHRRIALLMPIIPMHLKGTGTNPRLSTITLLEATPGSSWTLKSADEPQAATLSMTYSPYTPHGVQISSIRELLLAQNAEPGQHITLTLDLAQLTYRLQVHDDTALTPGWAAAEALSGITSTESTAAERLAQALHCTTRQIHKVLADRGDHLLLTFLPDF